MKIKYGFMATANDVNMGWTMIIRIDHHPQSKNKK